MRLCVLCGEEVKMSLQAYAINYVDRHSECEHARLERQEELGKSPLWKMLESLMKRLKA